PARAHEIDLRITLASDATHFLAHFFSEVADHRDPSLFDILVLFAFATCNLIPFPPPINFNADALSNVVPNYFHREPICRVVIEHAIQPKRPSLKCPS